MGTSEIHGSCDPEIVSRTRRTCANGNPDTGNTACAPVVAGAESCCSALDSHSLTAQIISG